jgi:CDP-glycerol glycerophosphotransferase (TagB/SpsB family)
VVDDRVWLVLTEPISTRVLVECGIVAGLHERLGGRLVLVDVTYGGLLARWEEQLGGIPRLAREDVMPVRVQGVERWTRAGDRWLDRRIGYYPTAIRLNLREGFHAERMAPGHRNWFLDSSRLGPLPRRPRVDAALERWTFGARRHAPSALVARMRAECGGVVFGNLQHHSAIPVLAAARRLGLPSVANVASWDHTVGKGVIPRFLDRYVVQNEAMREDLVRYHRIDTGRIAVTGWPQTDVFRRRRPRRVFDALLRRYGLDPARPVVAVMGNTPTNMPYEGAFVERLVRWWRESDARDRFSLLLRPHPRDTDWRERFAEALDEPGAYVQPASYTDLEELATVLQHVGCVVANAGTILLDALVNERPAVCVLYDEGAPPGERWAEKSIVGEHYRVLRGSGAFVEARSFEEVTSGIERALEDPDELAEARTRVVREVVGEVDGHAGERVVQAVLEGLAARA